MRFLMIVVLSMLAVAVPSSDSAADEAKGVRCFGYLRNPMREFDRLFEINAEKQTVRWVDKTEDEELYNVEFSDREISFITSLGNVGRNVYAKWKINRVTLAGDLQHIERKYTGGPGDYSSVFLDGESKRTGNVGCKLVDVRRIL